MTKIYIAGPLYAAEMAREVAGELRELGHEIVSTWHDDAGSTVEAERELSLEEKWRIGKKCAAEIQGASAMLLIYDGEGGRSGHVWEAGYIAGLSVGLGVVAIPYREGSSVPCVFMHSHAARMTREQMMRGWP